MRPLSLKMMNHKATIEAGDVALKPSRVFGVTDNRPDVRRDVLRFVRMRLFPQTQKLIVWQVDMRVL